MRKSLLFQILVMSVVPTLSSCASKAGLLKSNVAGTVIKLDNEFKPLARLGQMPQEIHEEGSIARYAINSTGHPTEYLIIFSPSLIKEELEINMDAKVQSVDAVPQYHLYLDLLLRAHRHLLLGEVSEAAKLIEKIENEYDVTYGTLVLKANLEFINGNRVKAAQLMAKAKQVYPDNQAFKGF